MSKIMLAKGFDASKLVYPVEVSIKLDGVAADFYKTVRGWSVQSRPGKDILSVQHILDYLNHRLKDTPPGTHLIGELTVMGVDDFKDAAGIIRRKETDARIILNAYDCYREGYMHEAYDQRIRRMQGLFKDMEVGGWYCDENDVTWKIITRVPVCAKVHNPAELTKHLNSVHGIMDKSSLFEGFMVRSLRGPDSTYKVGKRSWGMQKYKPKLTLDLKVVNFEEATANKEMTFLGQTFQEGQGLYAVGRIEVEYKGEVIGVGPGTMTHKERREVWQKFQNMLSRGEKLIDKNLICEVEYMKDDAYTALRQPVFKQWRLDKDEPNEE